VEEFKPDSLPSAEGRYGVWRPGMVVYSASPVLKAAGGRTQGQMLPEGHHQSVSNIL
jgi:hypothetical protein